MRLKEAYRETTVIQKSRFIACVCPCRSEEEARTFIAQIRAEFPDSSHVCTAYMIGENNEIQRSNDNGEPSGTAGVPMLESIRKSGLSDVCACVVRYFGGIKLGAGGLIRAYSGCVSSALANAPKTRDVRYLRWKINYPYEMTGVMDHWLRKNTKIVSTDYGERVTVIFDVTEDIDAYTKIMDITSGAVVPVFREELMKETNL